MGQKCDRLCSADRVVHDIAFLDEEPGPTPRGPAPPWAHEVKRRVDHTATGTTPPSVPEPGPWKRTARDDFGGSVEVGLFDAVRSGRRDVVLKLLRSLQTEDVGNDDALRNCWQVRQIVNCSEPEFPRPTLLCAASASGECKTVEALLHLRADPSACDAEGSGPLHYAALSTSPLVVFMLLDKTQAHHRMHDLREAVNVRRETPLSTLDSSLQLLGRTESA
eukprot:CAMPEP_0204364576 /NCGR_PEP_ID=MMETSP0469-20131031/41253_1 /ASSEMBLY_ACC=CAM_ASM_000384 /TAXON_ID=2969 /ORGANISM="Oxyrrhis marina" /LENGTH=220 /DNA_ID=CAMNT_0051353513 /DNA_START=1 /DNA_END=659 /DNA_ORIENTATION=-